MSYEPQVGWARQCGGGLGFGLLLWLVLVPMTAFGVILRATGIHGTDDAWEVVVESLLAFGTGVMAGRWISHRWRPALAVGVASLALALAMGGPIPVTNSARAARLFAAFAGLYPLCGRGVAVLASAVSKHLRTRAGS